MSLLLFSERRAGQQREQGWYFDIPMRITFGLCTVISGGDRLILSKIVALVPIEVASVAFDWGNGLHEITAELHGFEIRVSVDGVLLLDVEDATGTLMLLSMALVVLVLVRVIGGICLEGFGTGLWGG